MSSEAPTTLDYPFTFHGVVLKKKGENAIGECTFCDKADHFFVAVKTGLFNCRRCNASGNIVGFLQQLWESAGKGPNNAALRKLADERGLDLAEMDRWGLRVSRLDGAFLLPQYNTKNKLANLARIVKVNGKWVVYGTPTCKLHPFGTNLLQKQQNILWVTEGPWDGIALSNALRNIRSDGTRWIAHSGDKIAAKSHGVIAAPGATTFSAEWLQYFNERDVRLVFDNDHPSRPSPTSKPVQPGWDGMNRICRMVDEQDTNPSKLQILTWGKKGYDPELTSGYDVRDLVREAGPVGALTFLTKRLHDHRLSSPEKTSGSSTNGSQPLEPIPCESFDELCKHFEEHLHFPYNLRLALIICLATVCSTKLAGEQLWFRVIGPPGSGKTTLAECLSVAREHCFPKSILTGLHSGVRATQAAGRKEPSLVPQMNGKCVIIKDADTLLSSGNKDKILAELRDIYDGSSRAHYRTGKKQDFEDLRTTFLLCGTDALRALNRSFLGERFLDCDILGDSETSHYLDSAMASAFAAVSGSLSGCEARGTHSTILKQVTYGFINFLSQRIVDRKVSIPTASPKIQSRLMAMAQLLSYTRARVERDREEMCYRPRAELATRLIKQFAKLAVCLSLVLDKPEVDNEVMTIVAKVLHDTSHGFPFEIIDYLYQHPQGRATSAINQELGIAETTIRRLTDDMEELQIITHQDASNHSGAGGRKAHLWFLSPEVRGVFKTALSK